MSKKQEATTSRRSGCRDADAGPEHVARGEADVGLGAEPRRLCDGDRADGGCRARHGFVVFAQTLDVQRDALTDQPFDLVAGIADNTETGEVRTIGAPAGGTMLVDDGVLGHRFSPFSPACQRILPRIPGGTSLFLAPATVTVPGLCG